MTPCQDLVMLCYRSPQEVKCSLKGLALEPRVTVSQAQLLFGEVASHDWADQNLVLANQGSTLPLRFTILPSPYFHCLPDQGEQHMQHLACSVFALVLCGKLQQGVLLILVYVSALLVECQVLFGMESSSQMQICKLQPVLRSCFLT